MRLAGTRNAWLQAARRAAASRSTRGWLQERMMAGLVGWVLGRRSFVQQSSVSKKNGGVVRLISIRHAVDSLIRWCGPELRLATMQGRSFTHRALWWWEVKCA